MIHLYLEDQQIMNTFKTEDYYSRTTSRHINNYLGGVKYTTVSQEIIDTLADDCPAVVSLAEVN